MVWRNNAVKNECRTNSNVVEIYVEIEKMEHCPNWSNCLATTKYLFLHFNIDWLKTSANSCNKLLQILTIKNLEGRKLNKTHTHTQTQTHAKKINWQGWAKMLPTVNCVKIWNFFAFYKLGDVRPGYCWFGYVVSIYSTFCSDDIIPILFLALFIYLTTLIRFVPNDIILICHFRHCYGWPEFRRQNFESIKYW
jgi:hypothetical protein